MFKLISVVICLTIYSGYQLNPAIARGREGGEPPSSILLANANDSSNPNNYAESTDLTRILVLIVLISVFGFTGWHLSRQSYSGRDRNSRPGLAKTNRRAPIDRVSPKLRRQLLRLINDPKTANRLLMGVQKHHADRDPDWLAEKVIYDLRRGR
ncbi:MAG: hypothetical protein AAFQ41_04370 [Cyanobacteria bacterium J06623_7]